jgi:hypothetical protein
MQYGREKTTYFLDDKGSKISTISKYRMGVSEKPLKHYQIRIHIKDVQDEMREFIKFSDELARYRKNGTLMVDKDDPSTKPAFIVEYPKEDIDGSFFIIKNYCLR